MSGLIDENARGSYGIRRTLTGSWRLSRRLSAEGRLLSRSLSLRPRRHFTQRAGAFLCLMGTGPAFAPILFSHLAECDFSQVLHMRSVYWNDANVPASGALRLKLTLLCPSIKQQITEHSAPANASARCRLSSGKIECQQALARFSKIDFNCDLCWKCDGHQTVCSICSTSPRTSQGDTRLLQWRPECPINLEA